MAYAQLRFWAAGKLGYESEALLWPYCGPSVAYCGNPETTPPTTFGSKRCWQLGVAAISGLSRTERTNEITATPE